MGAASFHRIASVALPPGAVVEIGSDRGEGSSGFFDKFARQWDREFITVDFDKNQTNNLRLSHGRAVTAKGEDFLAEFAGTIAFLYLDNFDFVYDAIRGKRFVVAQINRYAELGTTLDNKASQRAHATQMRLAHPRLVPGAVVLFDDTFRPTETSYDGKGGLAVPWALAEGYELLEQSPLGTPQWQQFVMLRKPES